MLLALAALAAGTAVAQSPCTVPGAKVALQPTKSADTGESMIMTSFFTGQGNKACAALTNLQGVPSWSYCQGANLFLTRAVPGGTVLLITDTDYTDYTVTEMNMAGTVINSITEAEANSQLAALKKEPIIDFNHEAMRLPNGYTAIIAHTEKLFTNVQGGTPSNPVDVMGDEVLVLNTEWKVVWTWNAFNFLPVSRQAPLNEKCHPCANVSAGACCPITLAKQANDWLHGNSLAYDSTDGNLIVSIRDQDWVVKIAYENGTGNGHIVWTLGADANLVGSPYFNMVNTPDIPSPWFSHQHDVEVWTAYNPKELTLFDNGNTRVAADPGSKSRGQVLTIDESTLSADILANVDFPFYAAGYGTSQILDNGNYWWQAGAAASEDSEYPTRGFEYVPSGYTGITAYAITFLDTAYRSFRLDAASGF
jgi:hypothetical protein